MRDMIQRTMKELIDEMREENERVELLILDIMELLQDRNSDEVYVALTVCYQQAKRYFNDWQYKHEITC